jgi:hypothetical protein
MFFSSFSALGFCGQPKSLVSAIASWNPFAKALVFAGVVVAGVAGAAPAEAVVWRPGVGFRPSLKWAVQCGSSGSLFTPCFPKRGKWIYILFDPPSDGLAEFSTTFSYDKSVMEFDPSGTSLLCALRSGTATPYCPTTPAGIGTQSITTLEEFEVDQTGLSIDPSPDGTVTISYVTENPIQDSGEINFLAAAFRPLVPMDGATVTYSESLMDDATFSVLDFACNIDCGSSQPSSSLRFNPAVVPAPFGIAGLPAVYYATRRMRRRIRLAAA